MRGILADINVGRHRDALLAIWSSDTWRDLWILLGLSVLTFPTVGLSYNSPDTLIWRTCQAEKLVLMGPDHGETKR
jgi:hypothetical protein